MLTPTDRSGQFDVLADGEVIAARGGNPLTRILFGAGFPETESLVEELAGRST